MEPLSNRPIPKRPGREKPKPKRHWVKVLIALAVLGGILDVILLILQVGLPTVRQVIDLKLPEASWVIAADGRVLGELYQERRRTVAATELTPQVRDAFIAAHDPSWATRSPLTVSDLVSTYFRKGPRADGNPGGLSVPLAYGSMPRPKSFMDRLRIWLLARRLENGLSKDDLLTLYLNRVNMGEGGWGVEEAALHFYSRHATELSVGEAAVLASIAPRPTSRSPRGYPELALKRRDLVLDQMVKNQVLELAAANEAKAQPLMLRLFHADRSAYLQAVRTQLRRKFGKEKLATAGMTVEVSQDGAKQTQLEQALRAAALTADELSGWRGPASTIDESLYAKVKERGLGRQAGLLDLWPALPLLAGGNVEALARAAEVRPVAAGESAVGRVSEVRADHAIVELGSVKARIGLEGADWALASRPPKERSLDRLLHVGDAVWVRLVSLGGLSGGVVPGRLEQRGNFNAAGLVAEVETGRVVAMVGGLDPGRSQFDRARNLVRSVGAGTSMLTYAMAIEAGGVNAATLLPRSSAVSASLWDGDTRGEDDARDRSLITAFEAFSTHDAEAHAAAVGRAGQPRLLDAVHQLGFGRTNPAWLQRGAIGSPWALATAWTVFANGGTPEPLHLIDQVLDSDNKRVWAPVENPGSMLAASTVNLMRHWVAQSSSGRGLVMASHVGPDAWCAGVVGHQVSAVWIGPDVVSPGLKPVPGSGAPQAAFDAVNLGQRPTEPGSGNLLISSIDPDSGLLARGASGISMPFAIGTVPTGVAPSGSPHKHTPTKKGPGRHH